MIEQFFHHQYSTEQRFAILNGLALGARELASLPVPPSTVAPQRIAFPSKQLPATKHQKYITASDQMRTASPVQGLLEGITRGAIERGKAAAEDRVPAIVRERQLRITQRSKVSEVDSTLPREIQSMQLQPRPSVAFTDVAAEYFICPLINRFWQFLRDEQAREVRTAHQSPLRPMSWRRATSQQQTQILGPGGRSQMCSKRSLTPQVEASGRTVALQRTLAAPPCLQVVYRMRRLR